PRQLSAGHRDTGMSDSLGQGPSGGCGLCKKHRDAVDKWPRSGQANFLELSANRVLRGSRQSDSNRRPADYKSAALPTELCRQKSARPARTHSGSERRKVAQSFASNNHPLPAYGATIFFTKITPKKRSG